MFSLFVRLCSVPVFILSCIPLFLVSLGKDAIAMVRQPLRSLHIPGIHHHLVSIALDQHEMVRNFQLRSDTIAFLLSTRAGTGNLITNNNSEHFGLNEGSSRICG